MSKVKGTLFIKQYFMSTCETEHILLDKNKRISNSLKRSQRHYMTYYFLLARVNILFISKASSLWSKHITMSYFC